LEKNLSKAVEMASKQRQVADDFSATFPQETIRAWSRMVKKWEADPSYPNPYISKERGTAVVVKIFSKTSDKCTNLLLPGD